MQTKPETRRIWQAKNRERLNEKARSWRAKNPDHLKEYRRAYYAKNRERLIKYHCDYARRNRAKTTAQASKSAQRRHLRKKYGLSVEQYEAMIQAVKYCPVCRHKFDRSRHRICIDHCHSTGVVRGILCKNCNNAEGMLGSVENAERLYKYMLKNELFYQGRN